MTRRRALALGGAVAGAATLSRLPDVALARPGRATRSFHLDVDGRSFAGGRRTGVLRAPSRFDLVGVRGAGVRDAGVEVRVRSRGGAWGPWTAFGRGADHAPDGQRRGTLAASDPVWAGAADELQLRARKPVGGLRLHFVAVGRSARAAGARASRRARASHRARSAQDGGPPAIIPRSAWGGDRLPPKGEPAYGSVQMAFVHHTVSANSYRPEDSPGIVLSITKYHRDANGWNDIGYNFVVDQYGQVFEGRAGGTDQAVIGAQAQGWNSVSTGIATIGTFSDVPLPSAGVESVARLIAWKLTIHGVPTEGQVTLRSPGGSQNRYRPGTMATFERISGHRDGCSTSCPGNQLYAQLGAIRARATQLAPTVAAQPTVTVAPAATSVPYGDDAVFSGVLADAAGAAVAGAAVSVQKRGTRRWVTVARATTQHDGTWEVRVPWRRAGAVRAVVRSPSVRSSPVSVALVPRLTTDPVARRVQAGRAMTIGGQVRPAGSVRLKVERSRDGVRWTRVRFQRARVRGSRWTASVATSRPGLYRVTPITGPSSAPVRAAPVVFRAVRRAADVGGSRVSGGAGQGAAPGSSVSGGATAG